MFRSLASSPSPPSSSFDPSSTQRPELCMMASCPRFAKHRRCCLMHTRLGNVSTPPPPPPSTAHTWSRSVLTPSNQPIESHRRMAQPPSYPARGIPHGVFPGSPVSVAALAAIDSKHHKATAHSPPATRSLMALLLTDSTPPHSASTRVCKHPLCHKTAKAGGFCIAHGGGKRCQALECVKSAKEGGYCIAHGGGKRCGVPGCTKSALAGGLCVAHGGGKRCQVPQCAKSAVSKGLCIAHGGGRRCQVVNCDKSAVGGQLCVSHGGGPRCSMTGCGKGAVCAGLCIRHGGGRTLKADQ